MDSQAAPAPPRAQRLRFLRPAGVLCPELVDHIDNAIAVRASLPEALETLIANGVFQVRVVGDVASLTIEQVQTQGLNADEVNAAKGQLMQYHLRMRLPHAPLDPSLYTPAVLQLVNGMNAVLSTRSEGLQFEMLFAIVAAQPQALRRMLAARLPPPGAMFDSDIIHGIMETATSRLQEVRRQLVGGTKQSIAFNPALAPVNMVQRLEDLALFVMIRNMVVSRYQEEEEKKLQRASQREGAGSIAANKSGAYTRELNTKTVRGRCAVLPLRQRENKFVQIPDSMMASMAG